MIVRYRNANEILNRFELEMQENLNSSFYSKAAYNVELYIPRCWTNKQA
jgi:hypothetical protein